jgi:hypothetical protein
MSASDTAMLQELVKRIEKLEADVALLMALRERVEGKEMQQELYGEQLNHTEEREARRGPGRPPGR